MSVLFYMSRDEDGWLNLARDSYFLSELKKDDILLYLYINKNAVIIGKSQNAWRECNIEAMQRDSVQLVRRHTGGGAVFHDANNLNFSFIMSEENYNLERQFGVICNMLKRFGLCPELSGRNDVIIDGKKISGNAFAASKGMRAHHGTILVNTDLNRLAGYLNVSEKKMNAKGIKSVKSRVCNLCDFDETITVDAVAKVLKEEFEKEYGMCSDLVVFGDALAKIDELYEQQSSWEWRLGRTPGFDYAVEERFSFGEMQILFDVKNGYIEKASVFSDALDTELCSIVRKAVTGVRFEPKNIADAVMSECDRTEIKELSDYLRKLTF